MAQQRAVLSYTFFAAVLLIASPAYAQLEQCVELPTETATINGTVTSQETSDPVFSTVTARADFEGIGTASFSGFASIGGEYTITVAAPATYVVVANPIDFVHAPEIYNGVLTNAAATEISVTPGQVVNNIDFTVLLGATLTGTVTEEGSGDPIENVSVQALGSGDVTAFGFAQTDASGDYTIAGLIPGVYQVNFFPDQSTADHLIEVYDNNLTFPGDPVNVPQGGVTGIDAALAIGGRIEGTVTGVGVGNLDGASVAAVSDGGYSFGGDSTAADGSYSLVVASGTYNVFVAPPDGFIGEFYDDAPDLASADDVSVTAPQTTSNIDVQLAASGKISGRVTDANTSAGIPGVGVTVYSLAGAFITGTTTNDEGDYLIDSSLPTGQYKVGFEGTEPSFEGDVGYADAFYLDKQTLGAATPVSVTAPNETENIDQELVPCDEATTTTTGDTTTTVPETTTTIPGGTTTTVPGGTTTTVPGGTTTTVPGGTTTTVEGSTTTTSPTTSTTLDGARPCGDPVVLTVDLTTAGDGLTPIGVLPRAISASDALFVLKSAVGSATCEECVCDVNSAGGITATDALIVLRRAVGQSVELLCPACGA